MSCSEKVSKSPYIQYLAVHIGKGIYAYRKDFSLSWVSQFFPPPSTLPFQTASTKYCSGPNHDECFKWNSSKEKKLVFLTWVSFPLMKFARSELPKRKWYLLLNIQKLIFLPWWTPLLLYHPTLLSKIVFSNCLALKIYPDSPYITQLARWSVHIKRKYLNTKVKNIHELSQVSRHQSTLPF